MKKLTFAVVLAILLTFFTVSCEKKVESTDAFSNAAIGDVIEASKVIAADGTCNYRIVRTEDMSDIAVSAATKLRKAIGEAIGDKIDIMTDFENEKIGTVRTDYEILVGNTNRDESKHDEVLSYFDYDITFNTTRIAIYAGSDAALVSAADYFIENFIRENGVIAVPESGYSYRHSYPVESISISENDISDYVIISSEKSADKAAALRDRIINLCGKEVPIEEAGLHREIENEIIFSSTEWKNATDYFSALGYFDYVCSVSGAKLYVGSSGVFIDDEEAFGLLMNEVLPESSKGKLDLSALDLHGTADSGDIVIADDAYLASIDEKAKALKTEILATANLAIPDGATVYYVSEEGNDENDGLSPEKAWKSIQKLNGTELESGCFVLFERGGIWRGQLTAKVGVTYSAYGEGEKPCLYGSPENGAKPEMWSLYSGDAFSDGAKIWLYEKDMPDCGTLVFNDGELDCAIKEIPSYKDGQLVVRDDPSIPFVVEKQLDNDLEMVQTPESLMGNQDYPPVSNMENVGALYLRCDAGNPGKVFDSIEFLPRMNEIVISGDNVTINNLCIKYTGAHGIGAGNRKGLTVTDCEIGWIGGGIQFYNYDAESKVSSVTRFGNGVEIYVSCADYSVKHCYVYQVYDAGITHQYKGSNKGVPVTMDNVDYSDNLIEKCIYSIEYFLGQDDIAAGQMMTNIKIHDNIMRFAAYGWGIQRPYGRIHRAGAHIKGWDHDNQATDYVIENNIFDRSEHMMIHCGFIADIYAPIFRNNTFIQTLGGNFGRYSVIPTSLILFNRDIVFDERFKDNKFVFVEPIYLED